MFLGLIVRLFVDVCECSLQLCMRLPDVPTPPSGDWSPGEWEQDLFSRCCLVLIMSSSRRHSVPASPPLKRRKWHFVGMAIHTETYQL